MSLFHSIMWKVDPTVEPAISIKGIPEEIIDYWNALPSRSCWRDDAADLNQVILEYQTDTCCVGAPFTKGVMRRDPVNGTMRFLFSKPNDNIR